MNNESKLPKDVEQRFDEEFVQYNGPDIEPSFTDPAGQVGPIKAFLAQELKEREKEIVERIEEDLLLNQIYMFPSFDLKEVYGIDKSGLKYKGMRLTPDDIKEITNSLKEYLKK